jgi:hypothetical protein
MLLCCVFLIDAEILYQATFIFACRVSQFAFVFPHGSAWPSLPSYRGSRVSVSLHFYTYSCTYIHKIHL